MKITVLIENSPAPSKPELAHEHGLSLFIETGNERIIFDTGSSGKFVTNATHLGIDIATATRCIISHGHYDHGGGIGSLLKANGKCPVFIAANAFNPYHAKGGLFLKPYVGLNQAFFKKIGGRLVRVTGKTDIAPGIFVVQGIATDNPRPAGNDIMLVKVAGRFVPDDFSHEQLLVIREGERLFCFTGCGHNGLQNIIETLEKYFGTELTLVIFGGFHLSHPFVKKLSEPRERLESLARFILSRKNIERVITGHCTGKNAYAVLKEGLGDRIEETHTGAVYSL